MSNPFANLDAAFLARDLHRLRQEITTQSDLVISAADIDIPSSCTSLTLRLLDGGRSATDLAEALGYSHQLTTQRINMLLKLGLATRVRSKEDGRAKVIALTHEGRRQTQKLRALLPQIDEVFRELFDEIGVHLGRACREALQSLSEISVLNRINLNQLQET